MIKLAAIMLITGAMLLAPLGLEAAEATHSKGIGHTYACMNSHSHLPAEYVDWLYDTYPNDWSTRFYKCLEDAQTLTIH